MLPNWFVTYCHPEQQDTDGGQGGKKKDRGEGKLSFLWEIPWWQKGRQRKMGNKGGRLGLLPAQKTGNLYTHTHMRTHISDSSLALACRYDATVIHDS